MELSCYVALRIEWCKSRARAMRWTEEVELLQEEMRRVMQFFSWQAEWWERQTSRLSDLDAEQSEGITAYALRQASIRRSMYDHCIALWSESSMLLTTWKQFNPEHVVGTSRADPAAAAEGDVFE